ncbi:MAG: hypothetical protein K8U03_09350 [Planctomycetia bacterium]|nr:hypothetical protein [Planctomycetia bacterium]
MAKKIAEEEDVLAIQIKHYLELEDNRKTLNRLAGSVERQGDPIYEDLLEHTRANGGVEKEVVHAGYRLTIHTVEGTVKWKDEFIKLAGAAMAEDLQSKAEKREKLEIEPLAAVVASKSRKAA